MAQRRKQKRTTRQCSEPVFVEAFEGIDIDEEAGIVRNVKVLGLSSRNKRDFSPAGVRKAVEAGMYDGLPIIANHGKKAGEARDMGRRFGMFKNARFVEGDGVRADVHLNMKSPYSEQFLFEAANNPKASGISHDASYRMRRAKSPNGRDFVESLLSVRSGDWVPNPATTDGMFESEDEEMSDVTYTADELEAVVEKRLNERLKSETKDAEITKRLESLESALAEKDEAIAALESEKQEAERKAAISAELEGVELPEIFRTAYESFEEKSDRDKFLEEFNGLESEEPASKPKLRVSTPSRKTSDGPSFDATEVRKKWSA